MVASSITVTTVGLGEGVNQELLRSIADTGAGASTTCPIPTAAENLHARDRDDLATSRHRRVVPGRASRLGRFLEGHRHRLAPLLHGYVATQLKPPPAQLILQSDRGDPILARWRTGLGWSLAWTSDVKNHWSVEWLRWPGYGKFWSQLVREHMRVKRRHELEMKTEVIGSRVRATVDAFTADERFDNGLDSKLFVSAAGKPSERREYPLRQIAPGRYQADFDLNGFGSFLLRAQHAKRDADGGLKPFATSSGHVSNRIA